MPYRVLVLLLALSPSLFAGQIGRKLEKPEPDPARLQMIGFGEIRKEARPEPSKTVDLIVEFREPANARTVRGDMRRDAMAVRAEAVQARATELRNDLAQMDGRVGRTFSRVFFGAGVRVPREAVAAVEKLPYVAAVHVARQVELQEDGTYTTNRTDKTYRTNRTDGAGVSHLSYKSHQSYQSYETGANRGTGVKVAVIDTGIDSTHPALAGKVIGGWDFANDDADAMDDHGHGTHVAGIIAAEGDGLLGVAPGVSLFAYKVIKASGFGAEEDVIAAIERTVDPDGNHDPSDHLHVVNMSLGFPARENDPVAAAVERATAAGVLFCIASGNSAQYGYVLSPGIAPSALTVGAAEADGSIAWFSTRGPSFDYGIKPEISAPGVEILSTFPGGKKAYASGTSMASPYAAGVAALVKARHPEWSPAQVKAGVVSTARPTAEEVMVAGAGGADPAAADAADTLAWPAALNFGQDASKLDVWTTTRTVTLQNLSATEQTLTANPHGLREGVAITVTPASVTLAPGASATVNVELKVTNALVPAPTEGSLSYGGRVEWTGGAVPVRLPWAFVKGAYLQIHHLPGGFVQAAVMGDSGQAITGEFWERTRIFWPLETVDVVVAWWNYPSRVAIAEQVEVAGAPVVALDVDTAALTVTLDTTDESGNAIGAAPGRECYEKLILSFPAGKKLGFMAQPRYRPLFTPFSSRIRAYPMHTCGDAAGSTMHAALHEPIAGLSQSVTSFARPRWLRQDVEFEPKVPRSESMTGALSMFRFAGDNDTFYYDGGQFFLLHGTEPRLKIFYTKSPDPDVELLAMLDWWARCYIEELGHAVGCPHAENVFVYLNEQTATAEHDIYLDASPMGYQLPAGEPMVFAQGASFPQLRFGVGRTEWGMVGLWYGPLGERRPRDSAYSRVAAYDERGTLLGEGWTGFSAAGALPLGRYRLESVNPNYFVGGLRAEATFTGWVDTHRTDSILPIFTGLRIVDDRDRQVTIVDPDSHPDLLFSVADGIRGEVINFERVPPKEEATRVEYRLHGTKGEWRPLPALIAGRHYRFSTFLNGGSGTMYRVDLASVAAELRGPVDLRILVEDQAGNTAELKLEPAFSVGKLPHRRSVRH